MDLIEIDLTVEEREVRDVSRSFAREVLRPIGRELDRLDPAEVIEPESPLWEAFTKFRALGLREITSAASTIPAEQRARMHCLVAEEFGWGDAGLATSLALADHSRSAVEMAGRADLMELVSEPERIGCWCATEPDHGSDYLVAGATRAPFSGQPNCLARRAGGDFVISGQKSAWVSNGSIADVTTLFCMSEEDQTGPPRLAVFLVPLDLPGVRRGQPLDKLGQRPLNQGEVFFDDVRIPASFRLLDPETTALIFDNVVVEANGHMGLIFAGVARAALETALEYAKQRIQGGQPIIEHQSVRSRLFEMFRKVEVARTFARSVVIASSTGNARIEHAIASKVTATQTAFDVASAAVQILGGNGLSKEYLAEKLLRDARASMIEDGCNEVLGLIAGSRL